MDTLIAMLFMATASVIVSSIVTSAVALLLLFYIVAILRLRENPENLLKKKTNKNE